MSTYDNFKVVFTTGVFDMLHHGHLNLIQKAKTFGDILIIGLVSDEEVKRVKGENRPKVPYETRRELLLGLKDVDSIVYQETFDPTDAIKSMKVDIIVKGEDQDHISEEYAKQHNIEIVRVPRTPGISTTDLINKCL